MGTEIAQRQTSLPGLAPDGEARRVADLFQIVELERGEKFVSRLPEEWERAILQPRLDELDRLLVPLGSEFNALDREDLCSTRVGKAIAGMFGRYPSARHLNVEEQTLIYIADLADVPRFAVLNAIEDIRHNRVYDIEPRTNRRIYLSMDFPPSSVRIRAAAAKYLEGAYGERIKISRVLTLKLAPAALPKEKQEEIQRGLKTLARSIDMNRIEADDAQDRKRREEYQRWSEEQDTKRREREWAATGKEPPRDAKGSIVCSPQLAAQIERNRERLKAAEQADARKKAEKAAEIEADAKIGEGF